jgi:hypothetical protein
MTFRVTHVFGSALVFGSLGFLSGCALEEESSPSVGNKADDITVVSTSGGNQGNCSISVSSVNGVLTCGGAKAGVTCANQADCQAKCMVCSGAGGPTNPTPAPNPGGGGSPAPNPAGNGNCSISVSSVNGVLTCGGAKAGVTCANQADCQVKCMVCSGAGGPTNPTPAPNPGGGGYPMPNPGGGGYPMPNPGGGGYPMPTPGGGGNCSISVTNVNGVRTCGGPKAGLVCNSDADCQAKCLVCS